MSAASRRLVVALRLLALALIVSRLAAPLLTEATAWGLWPSVYLPLPWRWLLGLVTAGLALWAPATTKVVTTKMRIEENLRSDDFSHPAPATTIVVATKMWVFRVAVALLAAIPFYLFRIQHLRWGDAYILAHAIPHPDVRLTYVWQAPLDVFLHAQAWRLGHAWFGWPDPLPVYALLSVAAGVVFVWTLLGLADWLGGARAARVLVIGLVLTLGTMQLFFGYVENYTFMTLGVLVYLWLALRAVRGEIGLAWPASALALTHAFHPSTLVLAPSLLYVAWLTARSKGQPARTLLALVVPYALTLAGLLALMTTGGHGLSALLGADFPGGGDRRWFVPLCQATTRWERYTMFSLAHLVDVVNQQLLVAPMIWPALGLGLAVARRRWPGRDPALRVLALAAGFYLLLALTWNPDYGGQRDWDLFAPAAVPAALLLAYALPRLLPEPEALRCAAWALIPPQAFYLAAWIYQNTLPWSWN